MRASLSLLCTLAASTAAAQPLDAQRKRALIHRLRNDCGACHGMWLAGGLGPPITREALADKPAAAIAATIYPGRAGTPTPLWRAMLNEAEAQGIAVRLLSGFPAEASR